MADVTNAIQANDDKLCRQNAQKYTALTETVGGAQISTLAREDLRAELNGAKQKLDDRDKQMKAAMANQVRCFFGVFDICILRYSPDTSGVGVQVLTMSRTVTDHAQRSCVLCAVNSIFELCLQCFFSVDFVGSCMLRDVLPAKSYASLSTPSPQCIGVRSVAANSKRG